MQTSTKYSFPLATGGALENPESPFPLLSKRLGPVPGFIAAVLLFLAGVGGFAGALSSLLNPPDGGHGDAETGLVVAVVVVGILLALCTVSLVLNTYYFCFVRPSE